LKPGLTDRLVIGRKVTLTFCHFPTPQKTPLLHSNSPPLPSNTQTNPASQPDSLIYIYIEGIWHFLGLAVFHSSDYCHTDGFVITFFILILIVMVGTKHRIF
jgi:hypothetical protein